MNVSDSVCAFVRVYVHLLAQTVISNRVYTINFTFDGSMYISDINDGNITFGQNSLTDKVVCGGGVKMLLQ